VAASCLPGIRAGFGSVISRAFRVPGAALRAFRLGEPACSLGKPNNFFARSATELRAWVCPHGDSFSEAALDATSDSRMNVFRLATSLPEAGPCPFN